jgi:hypothetical protein
MSARSICRGIVRFMGSGHGDVKRFEDEVEAAGVTGRVDAGMKVVPTAKVVGSVGRWQNLRSDFFYKSGQVTGRFVRIGQAMAEGKVLPPIEVYKAKLRRAQAGRDADVTEYYVVDGHHRVAMAKKLGQDFLDAHVVEYKVSGTPNAPPTDSKAPDAAPPPAPDASAGSRGGGARGDGANAGR